MLCHSPIGVLTDLADNLTDCVAEAFSETVGGGMVPDCLGFPVAKSQIRNHYEHYADNDISDPGQLNPKL